MHAFWLVLTYDLLEDRRIYDDSARFKFDSWVILWTNHNSLLSIATNQFASLCIDNNLRQRFNFCVCQSGEIWNKKAFFRKYFDSLLLVTHSTAPRVPLFCSYHILTSSVIYNWTDARQQGIYLLNILQNFEMNRESYKTEK